MKIKDLKPGSILSENSFYTVKQVNSDNVLVADDNGNEITIGDKYVENILHSADIFEREEKKTMTELAEIFISSPRIAMSVAFYKKDNPKTKKVYEAEILNRINEVQNAKVSDVPRLLRELIENPVSRVIPGEFRVMKGRHYGVMNDLGRIEFKDMEDASSVMKQVDPRTIQYLIVNKVKYNLK